MNKNRFRKSIAGLALVGGLVAGTAGIAAAQTANPTTAAAPTQQQRCQKAEATFDHLKTLDDQLHDHYAKLVKLRDQATDAGKTDLATKITQRLDRVKDRDRRIEARLTKIHDKYVDKCSIPEPNVTPLV